jgi:hypothetical protein
VESRPSRPDRIPAVRIVRYDRDNRQDAETQRRKESQVTKDRKDILLALITWHLCVLAPLRLRVLALKPLILADEAREEGRDTDDEDQSDQPE